MGFSLFDSLTGKKGRRQVRRDIEEGYGLAREGLTSGFERTRQGLLESGAKGSEIYRGGFGQARQDIGSGFSTALQQIKEGYDKAGGFYDAPGLADARALQLRRVRGEGGLDPATLERIKAGVREEYGTGLRDIQDSMRTRYGDSTAEGLTRENLSLGGFRLGAQRAKDIRDIDIQNALAAQEQQDSAIGFFEREARDRGELARRESELLADLATREAQAYHNLDLDQASALAGIVNETGINVANLTKEEATILASLALNRSAALAGTRNTTNWLTEAIIPAALTAAGGMVGGPAGAAAGARAGQSVASAGRYSGFSAQPSMNLQRRY